MTCRGCVKRACELRVQTKMEKWRKKIWREECPCDCAATQKQISMTWFTARVVNLLPRTIDLLWSTSDGRSLFPRRELAKGAVSQRLHCSGQNEISRSCKHNAPRCYFTYVKRMYDKRLGQVFRALALSLSTRCNVSHNKPLLVQPLLSSCVHLHPSLGFGTTAFRFGHTSWRQWLKQTNQTKQTELSLGVSFSWGQ